MGFFDKVKDFLDDGKINGSTQQPQQAQPVQTPQTQPAQAQAAVQDTLEVGKTLVVKFGTPYPVPYKEPDGSASYVKAAGNINMVVKVQGFTEETLNDAVCPAVTSELIKELAQCSSNGIPSNRLVMHHNEMGKHMQDNLTLNEAEIQSIVFTNIVTSKER